jgi:hypothetical protein
MTDELHAFRAELAAPSPAAKQRALRRLESRIAAGRPARSEGTRRRRVWTLASGTAAAAACAVVGLIAADGLGDGRPPAGGRTVAPVADRGWTAGWPGAGRRDEAFVRPEMPDGVIVALPSLDGRDAGVRPEDDRGGWSECAIDGCYS